METIHVEIKSVYGKELAYPICENARKVCTFLTNTKTLDKMHLRVLKDLGFDIEFVATKMDLN